MNEPHRRSTKSTSPDLSRNTSQLSLFYCHPVADLCYYSTKTWMLLEICDLCPQSGSSGSSQPKEKGPTSGTKAEHY